MRPAPLARPAVLALTTLALAACGGPARPATARSPAPGAPAPAPRTPDPDLAGTPARPLLDIAWDQVPLATEADALALWARIAPTGDDWQGKVGEIPLAQGRPLAVALLRAGGFACGPAGPVMDCAPPRLEVPEPSPQADLRDPCLRRLLALWALAQLEPDDIPRVWDALQAIAALPPPESELTAAAISAVPEDDHPRRLALIARAHAAGNAELANGLVGQLDEAHALAALTAHHVDGALDVLDATRDRAAFLVAIKDTALPAAARYRALSELVEAADLAVAPDAPRRPPAREVLGADLHAALVALTADADCGIAAAAARALEIRGDARYVPAPARGQAAMMRALCVLASYEALQDSDEASRLPAFVPPRGLEVATVHYDPLGDVDDDGDGDPRTTRDLVTLPRDELLLPEREDLVRALRRCVGTTCTSDDRTFTFTLTPARGTLRLTRIEVVERPPCPRP